MELERESSRERTKNGANARGAGARAKKGVPGGSKPRGRSRSKPGSRQENAVPLVAAPAIVETVPAAPVAARNRTAAPVAKPPVSHDDFGFDVDDLSVPVADVAKELTPSKTRPASKSALQVEEGATEAPARGPVREGDRPRRGRRRGRGRGKEGHAVQAQEGRAAPAPQGRNAPIPPRVQDIDRTMGDFAAGIDTTVEPVAADRAADSPAARRGERAEHINEGRPTYPGRGRQRGPTERPAVQRPERLPEASEDEGELDRAEQALQLIDRSEVVQDMRGSDEDHVEEIDGTDSSSDSGRMMVINGASADECRIAILNEGKLEEIYIERHSSESHVGNIYKGRVVNIEPSIQAAFIDFGLAKNGFLHITDLQPQYFREGRNEPEAVGRKVPRRDRPPIQKCLLRGQEVIVQVTKEGVGTKGPTLTTYLSIPGRYLVMMPGMQRLGVSRKIEDEVSRRKMRDLLSELNPPDHMGFILRTAGLDRGKRELQRDLNYLLRLWKIVTERIRSQRAPCELYQESDLVIRTIRDVYTNDYQGVVVDDPAIARKIEDFLRIAMPRSPGKVTLYQGPQPIFHKHGIEQELDRINSRQAPLSSGGSLVIESTEAMVTIDVNSGRFREHNDAEETAYRTNLEAAEEIARQLRLRDLGGLIVCDFIDMRYERHKREVERALRDALKKHKERARVLRMSQFGIIEMTRQRQRPSIRKTLYTDCPHCKGSGVVKAQESVAIDAMRIIQMSAHNSNVKRIQLTVSPEVAFLLQNRKRQELVEIEQKARCSVVIRGEPTYAFDQLLYECEDERGRPIRVMS